ncbi:unnamed protein product [Vitrella brassicaformis CCMP3155]|uniref:Uncharacterized protein n=1 Tax=Vitrella brassicaformis (strain CCMP3155) TaxID=1169540 RepID=A0A0G4FK82_VITBC|nr:unnamed protein product [Vitrella brassicaformis CCMP3155]|eukprot:CEM14124.1 unnamed protein product [Vitrella brassicaformis CCMP3155]
MACPTAPAHTRLAELHEEIQRLHDACAALTREKEALAKDKEALSTGNEELRVENQHLRRKLTEREREYEDRGIVERYKGEKGSRTDHSIFVRAGAKERHDMGSIPGAHPVQFYDEASHSFKVAQTRAGYKYDSNGYAKDITHLFGPQMAQEKAVVVARESGPCQGAEKDLLYTTGERRYTRDRRPTKYTNAHQLMEEIQKQGLEEKMTLEFAGGAAE